MNLSIFENEVFQKYKSNSQRVRVITEKWVGKNIFCPNCSNRKILAFPNNNPIDDFFCPRCEEKFQLKSQKNNFGKKINDGAHKVMIESIKNNFRPNFFLLQYTLDYLVKNLYLIPFFFFTESIIEKRKPLSENAKRAGWVGCNILINKIPPEGKIIMIEEGDIIKKEKILSQWKQINFMRKLPLNDRGWTCDILNTIHSLNKRRFNLQDVYKHEVELSKLHPKNSHVKAKIRQQLQILRDKGLLKFSGKGNYSLI